ncbi:hypothetical protein HDU67_002395, partial [Dinochytrium kinnereticum]
MVLSRGVKAVPHKTSPPTTTPLAPAAEESEWPEQQVLARLCAPWSFETKEAPNALTTASSPPSGTSQAKSLVSHQDLTNPFKGALPSPLNKEVDAGCFSSEQATVAPGPLDSSVKNQENGPHHKVLTVSLDETTSQFLQVTEDSSQAMGGIGANVQVTVHSISQTVEDSVSSDFLISAVDPSNASIDAAVEGMIPSHQVGPQTSTVGSVFKDLSNVDTVMDLCVSHLKTTPAISAVNHDLSIEVTASVQVNAEASASTVSTTLVVNEDKNVEAVAECNGDAKYCSIISTFDESMSDETKNLESVPDVKDVPEASAVSIPLVVTGITTADQVVQVAFQAVPLPNGDAPISNNNGAIEAAEDACGELEEVSTLSVGSDIKASDAFEDVFVCSEAADVVLTTTAMTNKEKAVETLPHVGNEIAPCADVESTEELLASRTNEDSNQGLEPPVLLCGMAGVENENVTVDATKTRDARGNHVNEVESGSVAEVVVISKPESVPQVSTISNEDRNVDCSMSVHLECGDVSAHPIDKEAIHFPVVKDLNMDLQTNDVISPDAIVATNVCAVESDHAVFLGNLQAETIA